MSDIPGRVYRIAKAYLDAAKDRISEIDSTAQAELSRAMPRENPDYLPSFPPASSDPMERAQAKIAAARAQTASREELFPGETPPPSPNATATSIAAIDAVQTAYKVIGLPSGADYVTVTQAVNKLRERCAPERFPAGSQEQAEAREILGRVEDAYKVLVDQGAIATPSGRFDRLEL